MVIVGVVGLVFVFCLVGLFLRSISHSLSITTIPLNRKTLVKDLVPTLNVSRVIKRVNK